MNVSVALNEKRGLSAVCVNSENVNESVCFVFWAFSGHSIWVSTFFLCLQTKTDTLYVCVHVSFFGSVVVTMAQVLQGRHSYSFRISAEDLVNVHCKEAKHLNVGAAGLQGTPLMISCGSVFASEMMAVAAAAPIPCFFGTPTAPRHMFYERSHNLCSPRATRFKSGRRLACTPQPITYQAASDSSELQESADDQIAKLMSANKSLLARIAELESLLRTRISMEDVPNVASLVKQSSTEIQVCIMSKVCIQLLEVYNFKAQCPGFHSNVMCKRIQCHWNI
jgi:hypothetical protein